MHSKLLLRSTTTTEAAHEKTTALLYTTARHHIQQWSLSSSPAAPCYTSSAFTATQGEIKGEMESLSKAFSGFSR